MNVALLAKEGPPAIVFLFAIVIVIVVVIVSIRQSRAHKATLRNVARKCGGTFVDGGAFSTPHLELRFGARSARVEFWSGSKNSSQYTKVTVDVGGASPGILHILEDGFGQSFLKLFGAQDLEIGDAQFDHDYVIKATPPTLARWLFRPERRLEGIRVVRRLGNYLNPTFDLDARTVTVMVRQYFREEIDILTLIECARDFTTFVLEAAAPSGIILEDVKVASGGECPVCGTAMNHEAVRCESCRTPHHPECWQYMGRCSTYACKGTRSVA